MKYIFDSVDFKKYLFESSPKFKVNGLSLWVNNIPLPVDLFDKLFEESQQNFETYLDHLMAALLLSAVINKKSVNSFQLVDFPDEKLVNDNYDILKKAIDSEFKVNSEWYYTFSKEVASELGIESYTIEVNSLLAALSHKGKKYSRIYCPREIKEKIRIYFPDFSSGFATSNGDMFGNVIADELGLYRSGFSDCLATLFNKLLEFKLRECRGSVSSKLKVTLSVQSLGKQTGLAARFVYGATSDGALWEPLYDGEYKVKLNRGHPYFKKLPEFNESSQSYYELITKLSEYESKLMTKQDLKSMESIRTAISRALWIENDT